ncbi:hypothetical protein M758_6G192200 [Ceratodon purpureus]|nr:hypothetical protein M758_6G192200 [Ceratodon purpureus]
MAMAAAGCKPMSMTPLSLQTHKNHRRAPNNQQRVKSGSYQRHGRPFSTSFNAPHQKRVNARRICIRAVHERDGEPGKCNKCKDENDNMDAPMCEEKTETKALASPEQREPAKEDQQQQQSCAERAKPPPPRGGFLYFCKLGFCKGTTSSDTELKHEDVQDDSTNSKHEYLQHESTESKHQDGQRERLKQQHGRAHAIRCRLRIWWEYATRPQNLLAAFLTGLLLYAFALFGWRVMVVAMDVTLFVLKCSFVAIVLLFMYILLI